MIDRTSDNPRYYKDNPMVNPNTQWDKKINPNTQWDKYPTQEDIIEFNIKENRKKRNGRPPKSLWWGRQPLRSY